MSTPLSLIHLYTDATLEMADGTLITEVVVGSPKVILQALRGVSTTPIPLGIRASVGDCYIVKVFPVGTNASTIFLSKDLTVWSSYLTFVTVSNGNQIFYVKTLVGEDEDYGDDLSNYLQVNYKCPI